MRPRFVLAILLIIELFCLVMVLSPELWASKVQRSAAAAMHRNRTPETELAFKLARDKDRLKQYAVCTLAVLNTMAIIVYGGFHQRTKS